MSQCSMTNYFPAYKKALRALRTHVPGVRSVYDSLTDFLSIADVELVIAYMRHMIVFEGEQTLSFWMRDTLIPLSIAYIDAEGRIVDIQDMQPLDDVPPHYVSAEPAQYALEVNQGFFEEWGVDVGDTVELPVQAEVGNVVPPKAPEGAVPNETLSEEV